MKTWKLAISPCPNDTFIFYALIHNKISGFSVETSYMDVEALNRNAPLKTYDIIKMSCFAYLNVSEDYVISRSGAALGDNCGPLLLSRNKTTLEPGYSVAIPGKSTTANLLLHIFAGKVATQEMVYDEIIPSLQRGETEYGVIIHESRFTYQQQNLHLVQDLGEYWQNRFGLPIPLGIIAIKRDLEDQDILAIEQAIRASIEYSYENWDEVFPFIKQYAQEMEEDVIRSHIDLYVNDYTKWLDTKGIQAVHTMLSGLTEVFPHFN